MIFMNRARLPISISGTAESNHDLRNISDAIRISISHFIPGKNSPAPWLSHAGPKGLPWCQRHFKNSKLNQILARYFQRAFFLTDYTYAVYSGGHLTSSSEDSAITFGRQRFYPSQISIEKGDYYRDPHDRLHRHHCPMLAAFNKTKKFQQGLKTSQLDQGGSQ
jgi:hypothetical protein